MGTKHEDISIINCREIEDWCAECKDHRPAVMTATTLFFGSFGLLIGFIGGLSSTNRPGWHAIFLAGTIIAGFLAFVSLIAMSNGAQKPGPMDDLAERMERAKDHNKVPASEAQSAPESGAA